MKTINYIHVLLFLFIVSSCDNFLDVNLTKAQVVSSKVYSNDVTAISAINGIYNDMLDVQSFASGSGASLATLTSLSADEINSYSSDLDLAAFSDNALRDNNVWVLYLWKSMYKIIYESNAVIEGVEKSTEITDKVSAQLRGEAKFIRAFTHFYLVNLFGDVPLVLSTDYRSNSNISRTPISEVYQQIVKDLRDAQVLLSDEYPTTDRARPNRFTATALLSRVYLYQGDWINAEMESSTIIKSLNFELLSNVGDVFKVGSRETIWQLMPVDPNMNTQEAYSFILSAAPVNNSLTPNAIREDFIHSFEIGDRRFSEWINSYYDDVDGRTWYYPYKYKVIGPSAPAEEASVVFRLAEQYLIRAEARTFQLNFEGAMADVDAIRIRAGVNPVSEKLDVVDQEHVLAVIYEERRFELFTEWGHRWFDLKRGGNISDVLSVIKPAWSDEDVLYPIPQDERLRNPNLVGGN